MCMYYAYVLYVRTLAYLSFCLSNLQWASMTEEQKIPYERKAFIFKAAQTILGTQPQQTSTAAFSAPLTASLHQSLAASAQNLTSGAQSVSLNFIVVNQITPDKITPELSGAPKY